MVVKVMATKKENKNPTNFLANQKQKINPQNLIHVQYMIVILIYKHYITKSILKLIHKQAP